MVTIIISGIYEEKNLKDTMHSLMGQNSVLDKSWKIAFVHYKPEIEDIQESELQTVRNYEEQIQQKYPQQIHILNMSEKNKWEAMSVAAESADTKYVHFLQAGDRHTPGALEESLSYMEQEGKEAPILLFRLYNCQIKEKEILPPDRKVYDLNDPSQMRSAPLSLEDCLIRTSEWKKRTFQSQYGYGTFDECLLGMLNRNRKVAILRGEYGKCGYIEISERSTEDILADRRAYTEQIKQYYLPILSEFQRAYQEVPEFVQYYMMREIIRRFEANRNLRDKRLLTGDAWETYEENCRKVLSYLRDDIIFGYLDAIVDYKPGNAMAYGLLKIKYGAELKKEFHLEEAEKVYVQLRVNGKSLPNQLLPTIHIDLMEYENEILHIELSTPDFAGPNGIFVKAFFNEKDYPFEETTRCSYVQFFGQNMYKLFTFALDIPIERLQEKNSLHFLIRDNGKETRLPIVTGRYVSRINNKVPGSYWCFDHYMVKLSGGGRQKVISIEKTGTGARILQEMRVLKHLFTGKKKNLEAGKMRVLYWLTHPYYKNKNIWITFDKLYKGGDCGEYFYKYMCNRKDTDVYPVYLINEEAKDRERLVQEGYHPVTRGSLKQKLLFLNAKMIFGTHVPIPAFNSFQDEMLYSLQDRLQAVTTCIQHGLTVQNLAFDAYRGYNNNKRYYCASKYEIQNLSQPEYTYEASQLKLTGIPRYDGLVNRDQKQILITPTWRNYIAMPSVMGHTRPYNPDFKHTDYFKIYNQLIHDKKLVETAKRTGYQLIFLLHPITSAQIDDYGEVENVKLLQATSINYEKILCESSLMVTDYSGVQFDFAYMRKPVVYYHPPKLPPHYVEGGFFYDIQGFGEICTEHQQLVDVICDYMEHGCRLKEFYRERQDDFFAFSDHDSCKRIFEDAWAYQNAMGRKWK